jgi:tRNA (guanine37-N1)-methyltransferase
MKSRLKNLLLETLPQNQLVSVYNSYDVIGDIAILRLTDISRKYWRVIAEAVMKVHRKVKTVLAQTSPVRGAFRLRKLAYVAGEDKTATIHKEYGCLFSVDVEKCYFSTRLLYERMRIAKLVEGGEIVVNMFAGVGSFSIVLIKHSNAKKIFSIDINPIAIHYMQENIRLNRIYGKVISILGDAKEVVENRLKYVADRVLMPLPEKAFRYLSYARLALKNKGGWIHYYDFEHANKNENPIEKVEFKIAEKLESLGVAFEIPFSRIVRTTGPNWYQVALDVVVKG